MFFFYKYKNFSDNYPDLLEQAKGIIVKRKVGKNFSNEIPMTQDEIEVLNSSLEIIEFDAIELWNKSDRDELMFAEICATYLDIALCLPIPQKEEQKIGHILKIISFGYLGEKWESVRRFLIEEEPNIIVKNNQKDGWNKRLYKTIYHAIFYLIRKNNWKDLEKVSELIEQLRKEQKIFEETYLKDIADDKKRTNALEIAALYHFAKTVELTAQFQNEGNPNDILDRQDFHFDYAIKYCESSKNIEFNLLLTYLKPTFKKMVLNSVWMVAKKVNSRVTKFVGILTKANKPVFELLYPQRNAILEKGLLDPAHKAIVVNLPTSSGKTIIAEFRILQALNQFSDQKGWVVYVVPTRALVNQVSVRLQKDLGKQPLGIKVEKMSGALEIDAYEQQLLNKDNGFDILVTTYEKLNLLIRQGVEEKIGRPLSLVVVDEAQNIESEDRGITLEMMLSIIKKESNANFLLLTPFIPNSEEIAKWLDPQGHKSISIELNWQPNDRIIGEVYVEGSRRNVETIFKPIITSKSTLVTDQKLTITKTENSEFTFSNINGNKGLITALAAASYKAEEGILVISGTVQGTYDIAESIYKSLPLNNFKPSEEIALIKKYIAAELGEDFPLINYLTKGIGIHNSSLPDEIRFFMETLMEANELKYLVATTTIAQGINFPVSAIFMGSYSYPYKTMPTKDFWNLAGRAGRMGQKSVGLIGIAVKKGVNPYETIKLTKFLSEKTSDLVSVLVKMVGDATKLGDELELSTLFYRPEWSSFLQYISHMYKQSKDLNNFLAEVEMTMRRTYGYNQLTEENKKILIKSVKEYAKTLDKGIASISDSTGFSPETIKNTLYKLKAEGFTQSDWSSSNLFSQQSKTLQKLVGVMLSTPEINRNLKDIDVGGGQSHAVLSKIVTEWVLGNDLKTIAKSHFGGDSQEAISACTRAIYGKLVNSASWGLAALQKIPNSGLDYDKLNEDEKRKLQNLPAMIYYGVNSDEAVLLRKQNVPRMVATNLGTQLQKEFGSNYFSKSASEINAWLESLPSKNWQQAIPKNKKITGDEYKLLWKKLAGLD